MAETSERFVVLGSIAIGGMGAVHRALDRRTGEIVALKILRFESPELARRLALEADVLAALDHPAIVRLIAHGTTPQRQPFLAMEWLDGEDLSARLDRGRLAPREAAVLGLRVAEALAAAHARGFVHRDIKPSNLFLPGGRVGDVKVLDFGLARVLARRAITASDELLGTPGYMAPEQAEGAQDIDARADVFSLGAVLFECFTGQPPFTGEHPLAVLAKILLEDTPRVAEGCPGAPPALAGLVDRMLAKDRAARPQSAAAVAEALSSLLAALPPDGEGAPASGRASRPPEALTCREQRLKTVIMVRPARQADGRGSDMTRQLSEAVTPLGGRTVHVLGGSTLVTWTGAEGPAEQAARAARCALIVRRIAPEALIAVASGLGDALEPRPSAQVLDRAAALLAEGSRTAASGILLDSVAASLLDSRFQVVQGPAVLTLLGEEDFGEGKRTLLGSPTPFVGRDRELRELRDLLDACANERAACAALVTGPVGAGKSRLRQELLGTRSPPMARAGVWLARGDCMSAGSPFTTVASALRSTTRVHSGEPPSASAQKLASRVAEHVPPAERARVAAFLGELVGVHVPVERCPLLGHARQSPALMIDQIRRAWCDFLAAECSARPVLLVIEDLHWGDTPSVDLLDTALDHLRDQPFFILALARPEVHDTFPKLWARRSLQEIRLPALGRRAAEQLVRHVLGARVDDATVAQIIMRASGNAFYLEELIRAAAEGASGALPETVLAVVQARLDVLAPEERRVLRAASVFGETFWPGAVAALLGDGERVVEVRSLLDELLVRELVVPRDGSRFPAEQELGFRHALVRDGAYAGLTEESRALAHGLAAAWLLRMGEDDAAVLAEHLDRAGQPEQAGRYHMAAASRALMANDLRSAIAHAERSLPDAAGDDLRIERAHVLNVAYWCLGELARADEHAGELLRLAPAGSSPWCSGVGVGLMVALELGSDARLTEIIMTFMGANMTDPDPELLARVHCMLVFVFSIAGMRELAGYFLDLANRASVMHDPTTRWYLHTARGVWSLFFEGDFWASCIEHERALLSSEQAGQRYLDAFSHTLLGWSWAALGALDRAEPHLHRAIELSSPKGMAGQMGRSCLCYVLAQRGAHAEALAAAKAALEAARGVAFMEGVARAALSYAHLLGGALDVAEREARRAMAELDPMRFLRTMALAPMALSCMAQGRFGEALSAAHEGLGSEEPCRAHPFVELRLRAVEVDALHALGDAAGARAALARTRVRMLAQAAGIGDEAVRKEFLEGFDWKANLLRLAAELL